MKLSSALKEDIVSHLHNLISEKIKTVQKAISSAENSRDNETKSSAGDKYETGRAMMHLEIQKNEAQLGKLLNSLNKLKSIKIDSESKKAEEGSLISTNEGIYFIGIGVGKINYPGHNVYAISKEAPLGQLLINKSKGDKIQFRDREVEILDLK